MHDVHGETRVSLNALAARRRYLLGTADGLSDAQARLAPTVSSLTVGGLIKHVSQTERAWIRFLAGDAEPFGDWAFDSARIDWSDPASFPPALAARADGFLLREDESLAEVIRDYRDVAAETERVVAGLGAIDEPLPLPYAPWNDPGETRTAREVLAHLVGETAHHSGHADIIRETIDGRRTFD